MRRVLYLAYHFPPIGGAGVQRNSKFVRYLPEFGYESILVTGPGHSRERWTPIDRTMMAEVPSGTEIHRLRDEPPESTGWRSKRSRWLGRPDDPWRRWWSERAVAVGCAAGVHADVIYAQLVPFEMAPAALEIARRLRKPLVVDLQDPWALDEMMIYPSGLHRRLEISRMRRVLAAADAVVMNTPESVARVQRTFPELANKLVISIPNGFDAADFEDDVIAPNDGTLRIVHAGYLHTELGLRHRQVAGLRRVLGGATPGLDILTRSHVFLLDAINGLVRDRPELAGRLQVHLAGVLSRTDLDIAAACPLVHLHGYMSHRDTLQLVRTAGLLFLPMHDMPEGHRIGIIPGKTYEYIASGRPILAAVPDGDVRDLLSAAGTAHLCRPSDVDGMRRIIRGQLDRLEAGEPGPILDASLAAQYERRHLTEQLASVFDDVAGPSSEAADPRSSDLATAEPHR